MTPIATFLAATSAMLLVSLIAILVWSLGREQHYERQLREKQDEYAEALRRQGELTAEVSKLQGEQTKAAQRAKRMESLYKERGELIRELGLDPAALERGLAGLHGINAFSRIRVGISLSATLNRLTLQEFCLATGGQPEKLFQQMNTRLAQGHGGYQQDHHSRELVADMIDDNRIMQPVNPITEDEQMVT
ncbi:hypothetical protein [Aquisalimonas sp.]|uniref:hypothetical protein n=1 Tax=unclassified Aquisalimonas TaxID=2644645 RepID=UPI0025C53CC4|nr:hypothetical protein [Aquisalimonas sp.]